MASTTFVSYVVFIPFFPQFLRQMLTRSECRALPKTLLYGDNKVIHPQTAKREVRYPIWFELARPRDAACLPLLYHPRGTVTNYMLYIIRMIFCFQGTTVLNSLYIILLYTFRAGVIFNGDSKSGLLCGHRLFLQILLRVIWWCVNSKYTFPDSSPPPWL